MRAPIVLASLAFTLTCAASSARAADLVQVSSFGSNPGGLVMWEYVPDGLPPGRPLVVVMHGCTQSARDMVPAGWNELADTYGFAVVYPEQPTANNPVRCFNWAGEYGDPANLIRGEGENQSIIEMVDAAIAAHGSDAARVFVTGFSAGGAFTAVMLATWPDRFAAGAIMSGVPFRCATDVNGAYACQRMNASPERKQDPATWAARVREGFPGYTGRYPRVSIWHGLADTAIVHFDAEAELVEQWTAVHGLAPTPTASEAVSGHAHDEFAGGGEVLVERYAIGAMGHAVSLGAADPARGCGAGVAAAYFEDHGVCASYRAARFFGLVTGDGDGDGDGDGGSGAGPGGDAGCGTAGHDDGGGCNTSGGASMALVALIALLATLPVAVRGRASTKRQRRGSL